MSEIAPTLTEVEDWLSNASVLLSKKTEEEELSGHGAIKHSRKPPEMSDAQLLQGLSDKLQNLLEVTHVGSVGISFSRDNAKHFLSLLNRIKGTHGSFQAKY